MRTARPLGLSPDGTSLIVVIEGGEQVAIPADERLRAALRNDRPRMGQLEIDMESALRPREIQARIRAGESLEEVAQAAGVPVEKVEPFAAPVIAEREHIAGLAQTNPVRRAGDAVAHRSLRTVVNEQLLSRGVDADSVDWDAWRTADRRWAVRLAYESEAERHEAEFTYDQTGRFSVAANDEARRLTGEHIGSAGPHRHDPDDPESTQSLNDELAIVRAIQPQFAVTPDIDEDDDTPDNEDAFAEGDLEEVDGVYDIVPGDSSNLDVLYDMLSTFDEDSVQIYAGLVRPRPEQQAAPVLGADPDDDPGEPTQRIEDVQDEPGEPAVPSGTVAEPEPDAEPESRVPEPELPAEHLPEDPAAPADEADDAGTEAVAEPIAEVPAEDTPSVPVAETPSEPTEPVEPPAETAEADETDAGRNPEPGPTPSPNRRPRPRSANPNNRAWSMPPAPSRPVRSGASGPPCPAGTRSCSAPQAPRVAAVSPAVEIAP
ncbi:MAG: septation protein SepH [Micropruina sp.]